MIEVTFRAYVRGIGVKGCKMVDFFEDEDSFWNMVYKKVGAFKPWEKVELISIEPAKEGG